MKVDRPKRLPPKIIYKRTGPTFPERASLLPPPANDEEYVLPVKEQLVWFLCRLISSHGRQEVPGIGGFISMIGSLTQKRTVIDYYEPVQSPITQ